MNVHPEIFAAIHHAIAASACRLAAVIDPTAAYSWHACADDQSAKSARAVERFCRDDTSLQGEDA